MTEQAERAKVGDVAKDFALKDQNDKEFKLSEHKGKRILLSFHPMAWTGVCAKQMKSLEANKDTFDLLNTVAVGLSVDSAPSKKAWADTLGIKDTSLLADFWPHGGVAKLFGIFREKSGISERANILVDENGKIVFFKVYPIPELPDINEIIDFLKNLKR
ncbi:MAG: redoxin domain-containing protein [Candidatus Zixiibacteriota bacterium]